MDRRHLSDTTGVGTILNDDLQSSFSIADVVVTEGNMGTTTASVTIRRSDNTSGSSTVNYKTANGTATAGSDYTAIPLTTLTFAVGKTSRWLSVKVTGDVAVEPTETFKVNLSAPVRGTIADTSGTGTIANDD